MMILNETQVCNKCFAKPANAFICFPLFIGLLKTSKLQDSYISFGDTHLVYVVHLVMFTKSTSNVSYGLYRMPETGLSFF